MTFYRKFSAPHAQKTLDRMRSLRVFFIVLFISIEAGVRSAKS